MLSTAELREACVALGIVNIRVLEKIKQFAVELTTLLKGVDVGVSRAVVRSLVVIVWSILSPEGEGAPTLAFLLEKREKQAFGFDKIETTAEEDRWGGLLDAYGFTFCDEFDKELIEGIRNGFFDEAALTPGIEKYLKDAAAHRAQTAATAAWEPFHGSFDDNAEEVATSIFNGYITNIAHITPINLSAAVKILKDIGHHARAHMLLDKYIVENEGKASFDLDEDPFGSKVRDADVRAAFARRAKATAPLPTALEAARRIYKGGWSSRDEEVLGRLTVENFKQLFHSMQGDDRRTLIMGCLEPRKISNATPQQRSISSNAEAALVEIGRESVLNAHRLAGIPGENARVGGGGR